MSSRRITRSAETIEMCRGTDPFMDTFDVQSRTAPPRNDDTDIIGDPPRVSGRSPVRSRLTDRIEDGAFSCRSM